MVDQSDHPVISLTNNLSVGGHLEIRFLELPLATKFEECTHPSSFESNSLFRCIRITTTTLYKFVILNIHQNTSVLHRLKA
jgi:hypothetical protein